MGCRAPLFSCSRSECWLRCRLRRPTAISCGRAVGGTGTDSGRSVALDGSGNVYVTGGFSETVDFDPGAGIVELTSAGSFDVFVSKLDANGNLLWARRVGGTSDDSGGGVVVDGSGNVYVTGHFFSGTVDFDPGAGIVELTSAGFYDVFVLKLNGSGDFVWARHMGGSGSDVGNAVAGDAAGNVYITGYFNGTADFDPGAGTSGPRPRPASLTCSLKLDSNGALVWASRAGGTDFDNGDGVVVDGGNVYVTGAFRRLPTSILVPVPPS